jgi:hypothetical protein
MVLEVLVTLVVQEEELDIQDFLEVLVTLQILHQVKEIMVVQEMVQMGLMEEEVVVLVLLVEQVVEAQVVMVVQVPLLQ